MINSTQRNPRARRNTDHVVLRGSGFACLHCGQSYEPSMPCPMDIYAASAKSFQKAHARCKAPGEPRCSFCHAADHDWHGHVAATVHSPWQWPSCGDTGISSMAIYRHMLGFPQERSSSHPWDPADFGRCFRLLTAPWAEPWRARIGEMAEYNGWSKLVERWGDLEALYETERRNKSGKAPKLYALMSELLRAEGAS